jgi:hypothetical protein
MCEARVQEPSRIPAFTTMLPAPNSSKPARINPMVKSCSRRAEFSALPHDVFVHRVPGVLARFHCFTPGLIYVSP